MAGPMNPMMGMGGFGDTEDMSGGAMPEMGGGFDMSQLQQFMPQVPQSAGPPPWEPDPFGGNPYAGLGQQQRELDAEYHALHQEEAAHKLDELDKAAKFRRALGMITQTFATIAGRNDIAELASKQMEREDQERAERVQAGILAHVGQRALERESEQGRLAIAKEMLQQSGQLKRTELTQRAQDERQSKSIAAQDARTEKTIASQEERSNKSQAGMEERLQKRLDAEAAERKRRDEADRQKEVGKGAAQEVITAAEKEFKDDKRGFVKYLQGVWDKWKTERVMPEGEARQLKARLNAAKLALETQPAMGTTGGMPARVMK